MASTSRLCSGLLGTAAGPVSPPARIVSRDVSLRPPLVFSPPWHLRQFAWRIGRTEVSKNATPPTSSAARVVAAGPTAQTPRSVSRLRRDQRQKRDTNPPIQFLRDAKRHPHARGGRPDLSNTHVRPVL